MISYNKFTISVIVIAFVT